LVLSRVRLIRVGLVLVNLNPINDIYICQQNQTKEVESRSTSSERTNQHLVKENNQTQEQSHGTANPTWGVIFESSKFKTRKSLLPRFSERDVRALSFEL